jgi:DNA-binding MarR family transcriptional regulator
MRSKSPRRPRKKHAQGGLREVVDETLALFQRLRWVAEQIYGADGRSTARRGILRGLLRYGPQTVPELARARSVTRQNIQPVVDALVADGLAERVDNPAHARSPRIRVTSKGEVLVHRMDVIDARVLDTIRPGLLERDLAVCAKTLRLVRERFETGSRWKLVMSRTV